MRFRANPKHDVSIVCIFREEAPFLDEWIKFHVSMGVSHFYLYNNFSTDAFQEVLKPYLEQKLVSFYDWPVEVGQLAAYRHCVKKHAMDTRWMAFIDVDEFLFAPDCRPLGVVLSEYSDHPGVVVHSPYFGSAGHRKRPPVPITKAFTMRASLSKTSAKTVANPRWIYAIRNVHLFKYWANVGVSTDGREFDPETVYLDKLRLNHYWSRSLDDLSDKIARGDASTSTKRDPEWHFQFEKSLNQERDVSIMACLDKAFP